MNTQLLALRRKSVLLILPIVIVGMATSSELIRLQNYDSSLTLSLFYSATAILSALFFVALKSDRAVFPTSVAALAVIWFAVIGRIYEVNFGEFRHLNGDTSVFLAVYSYAPILYLFGYMLFSRRWALVFSLCTWVAIGLIVYVANLAEFAKPEWREGLNYLVLVVGMCHPVFIMLIYQVPPYAEAVNKAKVETAEVQDALSSIEQLAHIDTLTGLSNRRFLSTFWNAFSDSQSYRQRYLSLFVIDVDHFKSFNDAVGHVAGDECLKVVANQLKVLADDYAGHAVRYGGEEFLILIPSEVNLDPMSLAEQIRYTIQDQQIPHPARKNQFLSVSVGATTGLSEDGYTESNWMRAADAALYDAKRAGRNCSVVRSVDGTDA